MTALERFVILTEDVERNEYLVRTLLDDAADFICDYIGRDTVPERLVSVQVQLALIAYNKRGAEGESSRTEGGISRAFDSLPEDLKARLRNYPRKAGVLYTTRK